MLRFLIFIVSFASCLGAARAADIPDLPAFSAEQGPLQILLVAREQRLAALQGSPIGWVYEACFEKDAGRNARRCPGPGVTAANREACPSANDPAVSPYGGVLLHLKQTQLLRIRLVNCLPAVQKDVPDPGDFEHVGENGDTLLQYDPTNLHTHGLIVEPRRADGPLDSYGDYIFVLSINPANQPPPDLAHSAGHPPAGHSGGDHASSYDITPDGVINYDIDLVDHPEGLFWFHPHAHGLALNQISAGLAGLISVGGISRYHCAACDLEKVKVRYLALKDTQLRTDGTLKLQQDSQFCGNIDPNSSALLGKGYCPGGIATENGQPVDYRGGKWYFTVNGEPDPTINVTPEGEIWRIANTSGSATYMLGLQDQQSGQDLQFQVLAIDGVTVDVPVGATAPTLESLFAGKLRLTNCSEPAATATVNQHGNPVCADRIRMMPSSRVDLWVSRRNYPAAISASLRTYNFNTGVAGDTWPGVELAQVILGSPSAESGAARYLDVAGEASSIFLPENALGKPATTRIRGFNEPIPLSDLADPSKLEQLRPSNADFGAAVAARLAALAAPRKHNPCTSLPANTSRQIIFGLPNEDPNSPFFGLGYREVQKNQPLSAPDTELDIKMFDHAARPTVCFPLGKGGEPVKETWELVNVAGEDHNFHIHQSRFAVIADQPPGHTDALSSDPGSGKAVLHDNIPVPSGSDMCDGTIASWKQGRCAPSRVIVEITFKEVGDFVFHCHILEHEDGGMMAKISVVPPLPDR